MKRKILAAALLAFVSVAHAKDQALGSYQVVYQFAFGSFTRNLTVDRVTESPVEPYDYRGQKLFYEGTVEFDDGRSGSVLFTKYGDLLCGTAQNLSNETWCFLYKKATGKKLTEAMFIVTQNCERNEPPAPDAIFSQSICDTEIQRATVIRTSK